MRSVLISMLALLLLVAPAFGTKHSSTQLPSPASDLVISSFLGVKLDPAVRFPAGSHLEIVKYTDGAPHYTDGLDVLYGISSSMSYDDLVTFYKKRYPGGLREDVPTVHPSQRWSFFLQEGNSKVTLLINVNNTVPSYGARNWSIAKAHTPCRLIIFDVSVPQSTVDRFKQLPESENSVWIPIPK